MSLNVPHELAALRQLTLAELRVRYADVFGEEVHCRHKVSLIKRIVWRLQALAEGELSARARRRAEELANDAALRILPPTPLPCPSSPEPATKPPTPAPVPTPRRLKLQALLTRVYKGRTLHVRVLDQGFEFDGAIYKSLSAVAKKITGQHCNGYFFFRISKEVTP